MKQTLKAGVHSKGDLDFSHTVYENSGHEAIRKCDPTVPETEQNHATIKYCWSLHLYFIFVVVVFILKAELQLLQHQLVQSTK